MSMKIKLIVLLLIFPFTIVGQEKGDLIDKVVAVVGNEIILKSEIEFQAISDAQGKRVTEEQRCGIFEDLLFQKLFLHQARLDSLEVSEAELEGEYQQRIDYFVSMLGSVEEFEKYYGKSIAEWKEELHDPLKDQILAQNMQRQLFGNINITPGEIKDYFESMDADSLPLIPETIEYSQIAMAPEIRLEEKENTKALLDSIRLSLSLGKSSMTVQAAKWSEDPGSRYKGGCYDLQKRGSFVPEYEAAVFNTPEGGYSPVFETNYGYHFVYVKEKRGEYYQACHILVSPKINEDDLEKSRIKLDSLSQIIRLDSLNFSEAALKHSSDENSKNQEGRVLNPSTGGIRHDNTTINPNTFFILDKLEENEISDPVLIENNDGTKTWMMFQLDARQKAHKANLKDDYEIFQTQAQYYKKQDALDGWVNKKISQTYIRIEPDFSACELKFDWTGAQASSSK